MLGLVFFWFVSCLTTRNAVRVKLAVLALQLLGRHATAIGTLWLALVLGF